MNALSREGCSDRAEEASRPRSDEAIRVATTLDELQAAMCIRAAVFIGEDGCPYGEEFDGNDLVATHLLGYIGDEPAATMRVRWFGDFAKMERMAVIRRFRGSRIAFKVVDHAISIIRRKGYTEVTGHAQEGRERWWRLAGHRHGDGFHPIDGVPRFCFSGHEFTAMRCSLTPDPEAIRINDDPMVLNRIEGRWDLRGPLETLATNCVDRRP